MIIRKLRGNHVKQSIIKGFGASEFSFAVSEKVFTFAMFKELLVTWNYYYY